MSVLWKLEQNRNLNKIKYKIHSTNAIYIIGACCHYIKFFLMLVDTQKDD